MMLLHEDSLSLSRPENLFETLVQDRLRNV